MSKATKYSVNASAGPAVSGRARGVGILREQRHDPYRPKAKPKEGSTCPDCHAEVIKGAWRWVSPWASPSAHPSTAQRAPAHLRCPACERIRVHDPAGLLTLDGSFVHEHLPALKALIGQEAQHQTTEHPLERLMEVEDLAGGGLLVTTTGLHLARAIGHALERSFHGQLHQRYAQGETRLRVHWHREA